MIFAELEEILNRMEKNAWKKLRISQEMQEIVYGLIVMTAIVLIIFLYL